MTETLILASGSRVRQKTLADAGVNFTIKRPDLDERALEAPQARSGATPENIAFLLAEAKATTVSEAYPGRLVLGCDQTLSLDNQIFHKPTDAEHARHHLLALSGKTHHLNSAAVLARNGEAVWCHISIARMTMRVFDPAFIGRYLAKAGAEILESVGAYQVEGQGIQLFEKIDGDFFSIVGLPLLPVLAALREQGAIDG